MKQIILLTIFAVIIALPSCQTSGTDAPDPSTSSTDSTTTTTTIDYNSTIAWNNGYPAYEAVSTTAINVMVSLDGAGTVYYMVLEAGRIAPYPHQLQAGVDYDGRAVDMSGSINVSADTETTIEITELMEATWYDIFLVAEDSNGELQRQTQRLYLQTESPDAVDAPDETAPTVTTLSPADNATYAAINANVVITFSESMNTAVGSVAINPDPGNVSGCAWSGGNTVCTITHDDFNNSSSYTITLSDFADLAGNAVDLSGNWTPSGEGTYNFDTAAAPTSNLIITGIIDGPLPGGYPKAIELYALDNIADLSEYGIAKVTNGGGSAGTPDFTGMTGSLTSGQFIYITSESAPYAEYINWFAMGDPDYSSSAANNNGDDTVELYYQGTLVDVFGQHDVDGSGETWEYTDGWAYRNNGSSPSATFSDSDWNYSLPNALDGETTNAGATSPFPTGSFTP